MASGFTEVLRGHLQRARAGGAAYAEEALLGAQRRAVRLVGRRAAEAVQVEHVVPGAHDQLVRRDVQPAAPAPSAPEDPGGRK